ncbi:MAG: hypothetical protein ACI865_001091 [Flavobacteriaceae bacterium]|jgi:hypothetical protein
MGVVLVAKSSLFELHPEELALGITIDLILFVPAIYFLLIRKKDIPKITIVPFFIGGIVIASFVIPNDFQFWLTQAKTWLLPAVEITVFVLIVFKVRQLIRNFIANYALDNDFHSAFKAAAIDVLPGKIASAFATEIAVVHYGFFSWKKRKLNANEFSYHKNSGTVALLVTFIFLILLETSVVHLLLVKSSVIAAWVLSILSSYTSFQVFGMMRSMSKRPIAIKDNKLILRYGLFSETSIDLSAIESVNLSTKPIELTSMVKKLSPLRDFESHNVVITLSQDATLIGLYGSMSNFQTIALHVDEKDEFVKKLEEKMHCR